VELPSGTTSETPDFAVSAAAMVAAAAALAAADAALAAIDAALESMAGGAFGP
jgi:hypothetical protein